MPLFTVHRVVDALNEAGKAVNGSRILLLGIAYKPDVHDTRESPSLEVMRQLAQRKAAVAYCDPFVSELELDGETHRSVEWGAEAVAGADCVVVLTAHSRFLEEPHWDKASMIVDARNVVPDGPGVRRLQGDRLRLGCTLKSQNRHTSARHTSHLLLYAGSRWRRPDRLGLTNG